MKKISKKMLPICAALLGIQIVLGGCAKNSTDIQTAKVNAGQAAETEVKTTAEETTSGEITTAEETSEAVEAAAKENMEKKSRKQKKTKKQNQKQRKNQKRKRVQNRNRSQNLIQKAVHRQPFFLQEIYVWRRMDLYWIIMMKWDRILRHVCHPIC